MSQEIVITDKDVPKEVIDAVAQGRKVVAIKLLREATGLGLANAKVIVDRLAIRHAHNDPAQAAIRDDNSGRRVLAIMALFAAIFVAWRYFT
jgi:hypothetical protein